MERQIIIAGQGRAGTTLFYELLRQTLSGFAMPPAEASALGTIALSGSHCTTRPLDIFVLDEIFAANARGKRIDLVLTLRDPRDILVSRHAGAPGDYLYSADASYLPEDGRPRGRLVPGLIDVHRACVAALGSGLFPQGVFLLKYEHLVADPDRIQGLMGEGLGLGFDGGRFSDVDGTDVPEALAAPLNGARRIDGAGVGTWRLPEHRERIRDQFTRFPELFDIVEGLGYEEGRDWFAPFGQPVATGSAAAS